MKELSIEEKAKAYDKALDRAKEWLNIKEPFSDTCTCVVESIFPELKESEDERIRKELIEHIKANKEVDYVLFKKFSPDEVIAWLEKQTQSDKEEVLKGARRGVALSIMDFIETNTQGMCMSNIECKNLKDAVVNNDWAKVYAFMKLKLDKQGLCRIKEVGRWGADVSEDEKKKELKKSVEWSEEDEAMRDFIIHIMEIQFPHGTFSAGEFKAIFKKDAIPVRMVIDWLEKQGKVKESAISQRENQTCKENDDSLTSEDEIIPDKNEVRDKDEIIRKRILISTQKDIAATRKAGWSTNNLEECIAWLKKQGGSVKSRWKPSKEQLEAFSHFVKSIGESGYASPYDNNTKLLYSLLHDLEQLEKQGNKPQGKSAQEAIKEEEVLHYPSLKNKQFTIELSNQRIIGH